MNPSNMRAVLALSAFGLLACDDDNGGASSENDTEECGGHGLLHDDHCDCDDGYVTAEDDEELCVAASDDDHDHDEDESHAEAQGRLLVSDGEAGRVAVVDLKRAETLAVLETMGPARVYAGSDGSHGYAVQSDDDAVQGIDSGLSYEDHGDHVDLREDDPELLSERVVECSRPIHFVTHEGWAAAFCDGDGVVHVFEEKNAGEETPLTFDTGRPHHGVALVAFNHVLLSMPNEDDEEDSLPVGVRAVDLDGEEQASFAQCPGLHGEAATDGEVCFGCSDGVLCIAEGEDGELQSTKVEPPTDADEELRVGTLASGGGRLVGNWGQDLVWVDAGGGSLEPLAVGKDILKFAVAGDGSSVLVLAADGSLTRLALPGGEVEEEAQVMDEFVLEPGHGQLRPTFAMDDAHLYLVDPRQDEVLEVALDTFEPTDRLLKLPEGAFHSVALVGLPAATH